MSIEETSAEAPPPICPICSGAMWDNRASKRNPRAPDYKCKDRGCEGVIWPPRGATSAATSTSAGAAETPGGMARMPGAVASFTAAGSGAATPPDPENPPCPVCGGAMWDDRASKRNPRAPDFKCKNKPKSIGGEGCPGVIWPPRDGERRSAALVPAPRARGSDAPRREMTPPPDPTPPPDDRDFIDDDDLPF